MKDKILYNEHCKTCVRQLHEGIEKCPQCEVFTGFVGKAYWADEDEYQYGLNRRALRRNLPEEDKESWLDRNAMWFLPIVVFAGSAAIVICLELFL